MLTVYGCGHENTRWVCVLLRLSCASNGVWNGSSSSSSTRSPYAHSEAHAHNRRRHTQNRELPILVFGRRQAVEAPRRECSQVRAHPTRATDVHICMCDSDTLHGTRWTYIGAMARNRSWPAVSQIWILHASPFDVTIFLVKKKAPIVDCCLHAALRRKRLEHTSLASRCRDLR